MLRRSPRALALWACALLVAGGTAILVASDLAQLHRDAHSLGPARSAVIARHDLPLGTTITDEDVSTRSVHAAQLPPGVESSLESVVGRVVRSPVLRHGFVATRNLASQDRHGIDGALPAGMRAVRVVATESVRPRAGAVVDVIASSGSSSTRSSSTGASDTTGAVVVARGVLVIATDTTRTAEGGTGVGATLLVTPTQARDLAAAVTRGAITLALAPPDDAITG
jgi:Flp pilus assembly protein CpaB